MYKRIIKKALTFVEKYATNRCVLEQAHKDEIFKDIYWLFEQLSLDQTSLNEQKLFGNKEIKYV